jgi:hypothetical protein
VNRSGASGPPPQASRGIACNLIDVESTDQYEQLRLCLTQGEAVQTSLIARCSWDRLAYERCDVDAVLTRYNEEIARKAVVTNDERDQICHVTVWT